MTAAVVVSKEKEILSFESQSVCDFPRLRRFAFTNDAVGIFLAVKASESFRSGWIDGNEVGSHASSVVKTS